MTKSSQTQVLIIGGGFGGVKTALELSKHENVAVTLLSEITDFRYYPALYHTATGGARKQSHIPLNELLDTNRVTLVQGRAKTIDRNAKTVTTEDGSVLSYEYVVMSLGTVTNYFGIPGIEKHAYGIKSWEQIERFKQHIHAQLDDGQETELRFVIIGAGPTGIELAGELPGYLRKILRAHGTPNRPFHIQIVEAAPRLLQRSSEKNSRAVAKRLQKMGIELLLGQAVQSQTATTLTVNNKDIECSTVVWTAGMSNPSFYAENNFVLAERGKVQVDDYLRAEENTYVIGDNAGTPFSGLAQTALYDGEFVAHDILHRIEGKTSAAYKPKRPITVIPVGDHWAAVEWGSKSFAGVIGWVLRELADLIGFHDIESWPKATRQWLTEFDSQEECTTCAKA